MPALLKALAVASLPAGGHTPGGHFALGGLRTGPRALLAPSWLGIRVAFFGKEGPGKSCLLAVCSRVAR